jgi:type IV secretory pathway VirB2 component (pilin)
MKKRFWSGWLFALLLAASFGLAQPVLAGGTCWCAVKEEGACIPGSENCAVSGTASNITSCRTLCDSVAGSRILNWADDPSQYPSSNLACFESAEECEGYDGTWDSKFQPEECLPNWHYCYPNTSISTTLQVEIGGTTTVADLGEYINVAYSYLRGIGFTIAVVFIMVAGLQYVFAANSGNVGKAKTRLMNAVTGFVLLFLVALILRTVNPRLLLLDPPKFPKVKTIEFLMGGSSCEDLLEKDSTGGQYKLGETSNGPLGKTWCGSVAEVEKDRKGADVADGVTCQYKTCATEGTSCYGYGDDAKCLRCEDIVPGNSTGVEPSRGVCTSFTYENVTESFGHNAGGGMIMRTHPEAMCIWSQEPGLVDNVVDSTVGTCAKVDIDCSKIDSCTDYGTMLLTNVQEDERWMCVDPLVGRVAGAVGAGGYGSSTTFSEFCKSDPCAAAPSGDSCMVYEMLPSVFSWDFTNSTLTCVNSTFYNYVGYGVDAVVSGELDFQTTAASYLKNRDGTYDAFSPTAVKNYCMIE